MNQHLVSIIIPVYNVEKYLHRCLDSVINQTYKNLEIILIDDGSTDSSGKICDEYKSKDSRIIVIHQKNSGTAAARNAGLDIFKGDFVMFVDSDDYISLNCVKILYDLFEDREYIGMSIGSSYKIFRNGNVKIWNMLDDGWYSPEKVIKSCIDTAWGKLYRRYIFEKIRFSPLFPNFEDAENFVDISVAAKNAFGTSKIVYYYHSREGSKINNLAAATPNNSNVYIPLSIERVDVLISISKKCYIYLKKSLPLINNKFLDVFSCYVFNKNELSKKDQKIFSSKLKDNYKFVKSALFLKSKIKYRLKFVYKVYANIKYRSFMKKIKSYTNDKYSK